MRFFVQRIVAGNPAKNCKMIADKNNSTRTFDALNELDDRRIKDIKPLIPPQILMEDLPLSTAAHETVELSRQQAEAIICGEDDRLLVVVGPCSIHDVKAAEEYAKKLRDFAGNASNDLLIVMRVYFEKPRTTVGGTATRL